MNDRDDVVRLRDRAPKEIRPRPDQPGSGLMVGRVLTPTAMIAVGRFLTVNPVSVLGPEVEGGPGLVLDQGASAVPVYLAGPRPARQGDLLVCRFINFRWVAERGGTSDAGGYTLTGCPCTSIPGTVYLHVAHPVTNGSNNLVFPATLRHGPKPADLAIYQLDEPGYHSAEVFTSTNGLFRFRYHFGCSQGLYYVSGLMVPSSPLGYPGEFAIMQWLVGLPGNTCTNGPDGGGFALTNGATGVNSYRSMGISIDGAGPA